MKREKYGIVNIEKVDNDGAIAEMEIKEEKMVMEALPFLKDLPFRNIRKPLSRFRVSHETSEGCFDVDYFDYPIDDKEKIIYNYLLEMLDKSNIDWREKDNFKERLERFYRNSLNHGRQYFYWLYENMHHELYLQYRQ